MSFDVAQDGNLFPREDLLEAVAQSDWRDRRVPAMAWALIALGALILAAGLPISDRLITEPSQASAAGVTPWLHPVHALAAGMGRAGLGIEAAWFLISALALGGSVLAMRLALTSFGFHGRLALAASLCALGAPLVISNGRLPSDLTLGVLGTSLLLAAAAAPVDAGARGARGLGVRLGLALAVAVLLRPDALAVAPAVVVCAVVRGAHARALAVLPSIFVVGAAGGAAAAGLDVFAGSATFEHGRWFDLVLVGGALWLFAPLAWMRAPEEEPPPVWLTTWVVGGVAWTLAGGAFGQATVCAALVPALGVLFASVLARRARPDGAGRFASLAAALQIVAAALVGSFATSIDTEFTRSRGDLDRSTDVVVYRADLHADVAYLLQRRHGITALDSRAASSIEESLRAGQRVIAIEFADARYPWVISTETGAVRRAAEVE